MNRDLPNIRTGNHGPQSGLTLIEILIALIIIGIAVGLFLNLSGRSGSRLSGNSRMLMAGQLVEKHVESIRISIAQDTIANWPPRDTSFVEGRLRLARTISSATSPKTGLALPNVRKVRLNVSWGTGALDSLNITTHVTRRF